LFLDPSQPTNITQTELTHNTFSFSFRPPARLNGVVNRYVLRYKADGAVGSSEKHLYSLHKTLEMTVDRLEANTLYNA